MRTRTRTKLIRNLTTREVASCERLTMPRGDMRPTFQRLRANDEWGRVVMIEREADGRLLAWALLFISERGDPTTYMYVDKEYRRRGYGTRLIERAKRLLGAHPRVVAWNRISDAFYASVDGVKVERW